MQPAVEAANTAWALLLTIVSVLAIGWIVLVVLQKSINALPFMRPIGIGYSIQEVEDPPRGQVRGAGQIIRMRIIDELHYSRKGPRTLQHVDGPEAPLPSLIGALPEPMRGWAPIVNTLLRRDRLVVWVTALRPLSGRAAIHVRLCRSSGKVIAYKRFEEPLMGDDAVSAYNGAAMWAGAWLAYEIAKFARSKASERGYASVELLGTGFWESYAMLRRGLESEAPNEQRAWYDAALREDHQNIGALIALGCLEAQEVENRKTMGQGIEHLDLAHELLKESDKGLGKGIGRIWNPCPGTHADPQWFQCMYSLTVARLHRYCASMKTVPHAPNAGDDLDKALRLGVDLAQGVGATQMTLSSWRRRRAIPARQRKAIQTVLDREDILLANAFVTPRALQSKPPATRGERPPDRSRPPSVDPTNTFRDKREYWEKLAALSSDEIDKIPPAESLLDWEDQIFRNRSDILAHVNYRRLYNRACTETQLGLYAEAMSDLTLAFRHMSSAAPVLEGRRLPPTFLVDWAQKTDPALGWLRKHEYYGDKVKLLFEATRDRAVSPSGHRVEPRRRRATAAAFPACRRYHPSGLPGRPRRL
jgi:hypothetical protein